MRVLLLLMALIGGCGDDDACFTKQEKCIVVVLTDAGVDGAK